jgi:hypothetical protein
MKITDDNFIQYAMKHYDNPQCTTVEEFQNDLKRIKYIKLLMRRYLDSGELRERLIINHIVVLNNVFGAEATKEMLLFKIETDMLPALKTFLTFLNLIGEGEYIEIPLDNNVVKVLREI